MTRTAGANAPAVLHGGGGGIRTPDLWVMSPTSYRCSTPRHAYSIVPHNRVIDAVVLSLLWRGTHPDAHRGGSQRPRLPWGNPTVLSGAAVGHDRVRDGTGWGHRALGHEPPGSAPGCVHALFGWDDGGGGTSRGGTRQKLEGWGANLTTQGTVLGHEHDSAPVHCWPSTCRLATRSSSGGLTLVTDGDTRLAEGFPLRCFQRFARPNVATQRCRLPDNWSTSGSSSPVLSY